MNAKRELVVPLDQIRGIRYSCPICRRERSMSLDAIRSFYMWGDYESFCTDCARERDSHSWLEEKTQPLKRLAGMIAGREAPLKEMNLAIVVDAE